MNQTPEQINNPTWRWLWERLLLPLSDKDDADIVRPKSSHLRLVKNEEQDIPSEE